MAKPDWEDDPKHCSLCYKRYHAAINGKEFAIFIANANATSAPIDGDTIPSIRNSGSEHDGQVES